MSFGEDAFPTKLRKQPLSGKRMMIRGVQAVGIAKLKAGCGFQTYYPITPATDESEYLESHQKDYKMIVFLVELEVCAVIRERGYGIDYLESDHTDYNLIFLLT